MRVSCSQLGCLLLGLLACSSEPSSTPDAGPVGDGGFEVFDGSLPGDTVERGRNYFRNLRCANCHGADGRGNPSFPGAPTLVGRPVEDLVTTIHDLCADPLSLSCHPLKLPDLPDSVLADIAAYLAALARDSSAMPDPGPPCDQVPGQICTVAGNGIAGNKKGDGFLAREQYLFWPQNVVVDSENRPVITDWNNYLIRRIEKTGCQGGDCPIVNLIGTSGLGDSCSTEAVPVPARDSLMNHPVGVWFTEEGNAVLWGWHQWKIKYLPLRPDGSFGEMYCLFGNERGFSGDGMAAGWNFDGNKGPTRFNLPSSAVRDRAGNWYISDQANVRIRVVRPDGNDQPESAGGRSFVSSLQDNIIDTLGGGEPRTSTGEHRRTKPDYSDSGDGGPIGAATFRVQFGFDAIPQMRLAIDNDRNLLYVADSENNRIRVIDLNQDPPIIDTLAGGGSDVVADGVPATSAKLFRPGDVDVIPDGSGDVLITDVYNNCVRLVAFATKQIQTVAGLCGPDNAGYEGDGGPAIGAKLAEPGGAGAGPDRTIYIADTLNHRIRRVNPSP